jgi:coenzyme F420-reducing hydrogenase alpha subunit
MQVNNYCMYGNQTAPSGVFANLDQLAWEELIDEQEREADLATAVVEFCKELAAELYKDLEAEYEHLTSKESFIESCDCNEVLFDIEIEGEEDEIYS